MPIQTAFVRFGKPAKLDNYAPIWQITILPLTDYGIVVQ